MVVDASQWLVVLDDRLGRIARETTEMREIIRSILSGELILPHHNSAVPSIATWSSESKAPQVRPRESSLPLRHAKEKELHESSQFMNRTNGISDLSPNSDATARESSNFDLEANQRFLITPPGTEAYSRHTMSNRRANNGRATEVGYSQPGEQETSTCERRYHQNIWDTAITTGTLPDQRQSTILASRVETSSPQLVAKNPDRGPSRLQHAAQIRVSSKDQMGLQATSSSEIPFSSLQDPEPIKWATFKPADFCLERNIQSVTLLYRTWKYGSPNKPSVVWMDKMWRRSGWLGGSGSEKKFTQRRAVIITEIDAAVGSGQQLEDVLSIAEAMLTQNFNSSIAKLATVIAERRFKHRTSGCKDPYPNMFISYRVSSECQAPM